jgi:hemerythrin-like domain-containing protein
MTTSDPRLMATDDARPTAVLHAEHRIIERVLHVLSVLAAQAREGRELDAGDARDAVDFIASYADRCHHGKEEAQLFPAMERCGIPHDVGPTAVMRQEHDEGRAHVRAMRSALEATPPDAATFGRRAGAFVLLLRDHIVKEDQVLFPMAEQMLSPEAKAELAEVFRRVDDMDIGDEERARCLAIADRLISRYGAPPTPAGPGDACCCRP